MRFTILLPAFLAASLATASPEIEAIMDSLTEGEVHVFKRDAVNSVISPRDLELAERHNVDLNEMYKHSIMKRDDGDHVTIWVSNNYTEGEAEATTEVAAGPLEKRQKANVWNADHYYTATCLGNSLNCCSSGTHRGDTGPNAPYTGGAHAIISWGNSCRGKWIFWGGPVDHGVRYRNLIVAGTNSGANMRFTIGQRSIEGNLFAEIGCKDVRDMTRVSLERYQQDRNGWRLRALGSFGCEMWRVGSDGITTWPVGRNAYDWFIDRSSEKVV